MASSSKRDEYRRAMELEEARKAGMAPAAVDEDGKEINPHIPQFMTSAPWYMTSDGPTLKHQRNWNQEKQDKERKASGWYDRGAKTFQATKYRKGACQNCGAMTHKTRDCVERPRAKGARWTNKNIAADEKVQNVKLGFEGKRDRWNGYDSRDYAKVQQRFEKIEGLKQEQAKKKELEERFSKKASDEAAAADKGGHGGAAASAAGEDGDKEFLQDDAEEAGFNKVEKRVNTTAGGATGTVRNLRIREDTAKYLLNLDTNSAHYDPKSRSMRADPNPHLSDSDNRFRGDHHLLQEGEVQAWNRLILHSQGLSGTASESHLQALPSQAELLFKDFKAKKGKVAAKSKTNIEDKYGNAASREAPDQRLLFGQTERYVEYNRRGQVVKGEEVKVLSRYEEDVLVNNHTSVWGSWWKEGVWGYACCRQTVKNSYCTGLAEEGGEDEAERERAAMAAAPRAALPSQKDRKGKGAAGGVASSSSANDRFKGASKAWGEHDKEVVLDKGKLKKALAKLDREERDRAAQGLEAVEASKDERKRGYNSLAANDNSDMTAEEMEAYRMKKMRADDPMLKFKDQDL